MKRGRPKGASFGVQISILSILMDYEEGLNLKTLIQRIKFDRKTVINALKELCEKKVIKKTKVGRYSIHKVVDRKYYGKLRLNRALKETKPFKFGKCFEEILEKENIRFREVGDRLLKEPYVDQVINRENFDLILRRIIAEIKEERKQKRVIEID